MLQICQKNSVKLDQIAKKQERLETILNEQKDKISEILSKLEQNNNLEIASKGKDKGKGKGKRVNEFYQVNICFIIFVYYIVFILIIINLWQEAIRKLSYELFHEHKQVSDEDLKKRIKAKLTM